MTNLRWLAVLVILTAACRRGDSAAEALALDISTQLEAKVGQVCECPDLPCAKRLLTEAAAIADANADDNRRISASVHHELNDRMEVAVARARGCLAALKATAAR